MNGRYQEDYQRGPPHQQREPPAQYQQRPPPQNYPPPQQRRYDQRPPPNRPQYPAQQPVQHRPPPQSRYPQEWQQANGSSNNVNAHPSNDQYTNYNDRYYEDEYHYAQGHHQYNNQNYNGYDEGEQYPPDERYRQNAGHSQATLQKSRQEYRGDTSQSAYRNSPPVEVQTKPKERERILQDKPESPKSVPWDNPFGAFPTKKVQAKVDERSSVEENERARLSGSQPQSSIKNPDSRPATAQDNRSQNVSEDYSNLPRSQGFRGSSEQQPGSYRHKIPRKPAQQSRPDDTKQYAPPQRTMTGPIPEHLNNGFDKTQPYDNPHPGVVRQQTYDGFSHIGPASQDHYRDDGRTRRELPPHSLPQSPIRGEPQISNVPTALHAKGIDPRQPPLTRAATEPYAPQDTASYPSQNVSTNREVPNFDAMASNTNEDQLSPSQHLEAVQPYRKPTYHHAPPVQQTVATNQHMQQELVAPLADFSFDLPTTGGVQPPRRQRSSLDQMHNGNSYLAQTASPVDQMSISQYPPRSASRGDMRPPTRDPYRQPPPPMPQDRSGPIYPQGPGDASREQNQYYQQPRPQTANGYGSFQDNSHQRPAMRTDPSRSGYDSRLQPDRISNPTSMSQYHNPPPRPATSNSMPMYANGGDQRTSFDGQRTNGRNHPDPSAHPVPFRPGLMQPSPSPSPVPTSIPVQRQTPAPGPPSASDQTPITLQELNHLRVSYQSNPEDHALGFTFAKRLVEAAKVLAPQNPDPKQMAKSRERYILDAHKTLKRLIQNGYTDAMFYMADCYGQGSLGLQPDPKEAFQLYQSAAKMGHAQAAYRVAVCCELGPEDGGGTRRDPLKAVQWYKRAASLGDAPAMYKMGMIQLKGLLGQPRNPREAISWLKRAAERADQENPHALHELALLYESAQSTDIIVRDERYALQLFTQAAELGYKYSQFRLGSVYEYGKLGCVIDPRLSIAWYSKAAAQGEHQAEFALSGWYLTGSGPLGPGLPPLLEQSDAEAYLWARKAAASGLAKAEYAMGYYTEVGIGVSPSMEEAKKWYFRAAAQNHPKARQRLEDLKRGGARMQKTRVSRSNVGKHNEGDCVVM